MIRKATEIYKKRGIRELISIAVPYIVRTILSRLMALCTKAFEVRRGRGVDVTAEDWDNLVILDACRYDAFAQENESPGELREVVSAGRESHEFIEQNFLDKHLHDTVYVTANPHVTYIPEGTFHAVIGDPLTDQFDEELGTVPPRAVTQAALNAHDQFPNKRLIIHYMQPHMPPIGDIRLDFTELQDGFDLVGTDGEFNRFFNLVDDGVIEPAVARKAYRQNLRLVLEEVDNLEQLSGKTVVTADHGELLGERPCPLMGPSWSHQVTRYEPQWTPFRFPKCKELCTVPWFVPESDKERREVKASEPVGEERLSEHTAQQQLEALGYRT
jgi:hypothetical protein